jgi:hypothetical protein
MKSIKIDKNFNLDDYLNEVKPFFENNELFFNKTLKYSDETFIKIIYFLYHLKQNLNYDKFNFIPTEDISKPNNGFEFINKKENNKLGVYHTHINEKDKTVLIWYLIWNAETFYLKFDIIIHPRDDYKNYIKNIYLNEIDGFNSNIEYFEYFINLNHIL